ncbi:antitoxin MazE family protein [Agrobacterium larrymoorei]|uniref:Antitoxin MazE family protein n=1 Tax=Agrobacterium larrymoorei TaxID=160699 RepID=A0AAF0HDB4_9HYPH|nr:antitoxin MazE family protein [Agrobacterium larrymoorei]WHA42261.1 antitoxin MazE family protein [Agrobacterium larrymoorei]
MATTVNHRVQKRREALRASGLRPVQIWVPDTRLAGFAEECRRQSHLVAELDHQDAEFAAFADAALSDLDDEGSK